MASDPKTPPPDAEQQALLDAVWAVLGPMARLAVARGLPYAALEDTLRRAMVKAAADVHPQVPPHRSVSRIATATGINRREVTRLTRDDPETNHRPGRSAASEVFTHWVSDRGYRDRRGVPKVLPRLGPAPSFESLAQTVTRDVHPRSLLDELLRLKLAVLDEASDTVALRRDGFVPSGDRVRMLGFLAENVGDHLAASVANVVGGGRSHFEQAIFADGLSAASMDEVRKLVTAHWKLLLEALVPPLEKLIETDGDLPLAQRRRVRIGLYGFDDLTGEARRAARAAAVPEPVATKRRPRRS